MLLIYRCISSVDERMGGKKTNNNFLSHSGHAHIAFIHDDVIKRKHFRVTSLLCGESLATGEFPSQRPLTRSFDVFFDLRLKKQLSKQSRRRSFETPLGSLWHHCNVVIYFLDLIIRIFYRAKLQLDWVWFIMVTHFFVKKKYENIMSRLWRFFCMSLHQMNSQLPLCAEAPFHLNGSTLITVWISSYLHHEM